MITWENITMWYLIVNLWIMVIFTIVTGIGGAFDLVYLFRQLKSKRIDELDNGRVIEEEKNNHKKD